VVVDAVADVPSGLVVAFATLLGAVVGSFLNVCILRWPAEQSVVRPASRCPRCGRGLAWYDNIPIVSWIVLRARCRGCGLPISLMYPMVELACALLWGWLASRYGLSLETLRGATFGTILIGITLTDAREMIIPDEFSIGGLVLGLLFSVAGGWAGLREAALGAAVGFGGLWLVGAAGTWLLKQDAMGGGDIKMMAMVGAFLGWRGVVATVLVGAVLGLLAFGPVALMRGQSKYELPFGIFLAAGALVFYVAGGTLMHWYYVYLGLA
jgi:leader peptidase (prepilin peptidase)/N-methyltransferase